MDRVNDLLPYIEEFYKDELVVEEEALEILRESHVAELLQVFADKLGQLENYDKEGIKNAIKECQKELKIKGKQLFMPIRVGISGTMHGSDLVTTIALLGRERVIHRLDQAREVL